VSAEPSIEYTQRFDNEGFEVPHGEIYLMACCDCGLVHDFVFISGDEKPIGVAARRNEVETAKRRQHEGPALISKGQARSLIRRYVARTMGGSASHRAALHELINEVYAQGHRAGRTKLEPTNG
jgi:hypothetical protein